MEFRVLFSPSPYSRCRHCIEFQFKMILWKMWLEGSETWDVFCLFAQSSHITRGTCHVIVNNFTVFCIVECDKLKLWHLLFIFIHFGVCSLRLGWVSNENRCGLSLCVLIKLKIVFRRWFCDYGNLWRMDWEILWDEWDLAEEIWWIFNHGVGKFKEIIEIWRFLNFFELIGGFWRES